MTWKHMGALLFSVGLVGVGCSTSDALPFGVMPGTTPPGTTTPPGGDVPGTPRTAGPTAVGKPTAAPSVLKIGAAGGTLASADKRVQLIVPPNALASDVEIKMTPISNETPLGLGYAVRLEPSGTTFTTPAKLVFAYEAWGSSTVPELLFGATQGADNTWTVAGAPILDTAAKTLTVDLPHFSDWSLSTCAKLSASTYVLTAGQEASLAVEEQCESPAAGTLLGGISPTSLPVTWSKKDSRGNPGPGTLTPSGSTAKLVGETNPSAVTDPLVRVTAEWSSRSGTRTLSDEIATSSMLSFSLEGQSVIATNAFVSTIQGKSYINGVAQGGAAGGNVIAIQVLLTGTGSASTNPADGLPASANIGATQYDDSYTECGGDPKWVTTFVTVGRANRERQYITGTFDGTMMVTHGTVDCMGSPMPKEDQVPVTGAFFTIWQNGD